MAGSALNFGTSQNLDAINERWDDLALTRLDDDRTIYVGLTSGGASDTTGDGSDALPFATVTKAFDSIKNNRLSPGVIVTIHIKAGFYDIDDTFFPCVNDYDPQFGGPAENTFKADSGYLSKQVHPDIEQIIITGEEPKDRRFINLHGDGLSGNVSYQYETDWQHTGDTYRLEFGIHKMSCAVGLIDGETIDDLTSGMTYASIYCNELSTTHEGPNSGGVGNGKTFFQGGPRMGRGWGINPTDEGLSGTHEGGSAAYPYDDATDTMLSTSEANNGETPRSLARYFVLGCHEIAGVCAESSGICGHGVNLNNNNYIITKDNYAVSSDLPYKSCNGAMVYGDWCPNVYMDDYDRNENIFAGTKSGYSGGNGATAHAMAAYGNGGDGSTGTVVPSSSDIFDLTAGLTDSGGPFENDENIRIRFHGTVIRRLKDTWTLSGNDNPSFISATAPCMLYVDNCDAQIRNLCLIGDELYSNPDSDNRNCINIMGGGSLVPQKLSIREWRNGIQLVGDNSNLTVTGRWAEDQATGNTIRGTGDLIISKCEVGIFAYLFGSHVSLNNTFLCGNRLYGLRCESGEVNCYKTYSIGTVGHHFYLTGCNESEFHHCYALWAGQAMSNARSCCIQNWGPGEDDYPTYSYGYMGDHQDERNMEKTWAVRSPYGGYAFLIYESDNVIRNCIMGWCHTAVYNKNTNGDMLQNLCFNTYGRWVDVTGNSNVKVSHCAFYTNFWPTGINVSHKSRLTLADSTIRGQGRHRPFYSGTGTITVSYSSSLYLYRTIMDETIGLSNPYVDGDNHSGGTSVARQQGTPTIGTFGTSSLGIYVLGSSTAWIQSFGSFYIPRKYDFYIRQRGKIHILNTDRTGIWNYLPEPSACQSPGASGAKASRLNPYAFNADGTGSVQGKYTGNTRSDMWDVSDWWVTDDIEQNRALAFGDDAAHKITTIPHYGSYWPGELTDRETRVTGFTGSTGPDSWIAD